MKKKLPVKKAKATTKKVVVGAKKVKVVAKKAVVKKGFLSYKDGGKVVKGVDNTADYVYILKTPEGKNQEVPYNTFKTSEGKKTKMKKNVDGNPTMGGTGGALYTDYIKMKKGGTIKKKESVSVEMDGKTFTGTVRGGVRRSVMKVSNPTEGSSKMIDKFRNDGSLKSQKIIDKTAKGKTFQKIKKFVPIPENKMKKGGTKRK